jgi:hypothetical protein
MQVRDAALQIVAPVDHYFDAEIVSKWNPTSVETCGTFTVRLPMESRAAAALREDGAGLVASLDGVRFFSGLVEEPERTRTAGGRGVLSVFGRSDDALLAVRNAWPVPSSDDLAAQGGSAYDVRTGAGETVVKAYVSANAGAASPVARRVPSLAVPTSTGLGSSVTGRARFTGLAELVSSLCVAAGGLGWRVVQQGNQLVFEVFEPRDRSKHARFSVALRNLTSYKLATPKATVSRAITAGGGEGTARIFRQALNSSAWHAYRESFVDQRQTTDLAELDQAAAEALAEGEGKPSFSAPVQDTPAVAFLRDYGPLDLVTVSAEGVPYVDVVTQASVRATPERLTVIPTVGAPDAGPLPGLVTRLRAAERRLAHIERSQ